MADSKYLEIYFGTRKLDMLSQEQVEAGKGKLLAGIAQAQTGEEEIHLWLIANDLGIAPPPEDLRFAEARIYARTISMMPPTNQEK